MIDLHCHILAGIDDGPRTIEQSIALARAQVDAGVRVVVATPHVNERYATNDADAIASRLSELRAALAERRIPLRLVAGAEVALNVAEVLPNAELTRLRLGSGRWLLVEPPESGSAGEVGETLRAVRDRGHKVLVAHPERCGELARDLGLLRELVEDGLALQVTASALSGRFGRKVMRRASRIIDHGLAQVLASDAHDLRGRGPGLDGLPPDILRWMTVETPRALLDGLRLPPPPASARR